jgi:hypothetical protein
MKTNKRIPPALTLFLLSPVIGELLSGSAPPVEFFQPASLIFLGILYGGGAILIRELAVRWKKGWPTILMLGAAYGIIEEGLIVKSFFDPYWMDLGLLGVYGRWGGVNWVWSLYLTIYHATISIALPILLVGLIYPQDQDRAWLSKRSFRWLSVLFILNGVFIFAAITPYRPPSFPYMVTLFLVIVLIPIARRLPAAFSRHGKAKPRSAFRFGLLGFGAMACLFLINGALPHSRIPAWVTLLIDVFLVAAIIQFLRRMMAISEIESQHRLWALACGALGFFITLAPLQELDTDRLDNTSGMTLVGLGILIFLIWVGRRLKHQKTTPVSNGFI